MDNKKREYEMKARTLDSIMRHPKLSRIFSDSIKSPIGSTKRKQSQAALNIITKVNKRADGMGGPGWYMPTATGTSQPQGPAQLSPSAYGTPYTSGGVTKQDVTLPSGRKTTVIVGATPAKKQYATGSLPWIGQKGGEKLGPITAGTAAVGLGALGKMNELYATTPGRFANSFKNFGNFLIGEDFNNKYTPGPTTQRIIDAGYAPSSTAWNSYWNMTNRSGAQQPAGQPGAAGTQQPGQQTPPAETPVGSETTPPASGAPQTGAPQSGTPQSGTPQSGGGSYSGAADIGVKSSSTPTTVGGATARLASGKAGAYLPGGTNDMGANYFATKMMSDQATLKQLFPGVPDEDLPMGASLYDQIDRLADTLKNEYHIDLLGNEYAAKARAGVTLEQDLWNYTKAKDEQLNAIEQMIRDAEEKSAFNDTSDPNVANLNRNYMNYLTIMKGRANTRYIDMVSQSAGVFEQQLKGLEGSLNNAVNQYNEEFSRKSTGLQEDYNRWYTTLTDMYNQVADAPRKQMELDLMQMQMDQAKMALVQAYEQSATKPGVDGTGYSEKDYRDAYNFIESKLINKDKIFQGEGTPSIETLLLQTPGSKQAIINAYTTLLGDAITKAQDPAEYARLNKLKDDFYASATNGVIGEIMVNSGSPAFVQSVASIADDLDKKSYYRDANVVRQNTQLYRDALKDLFSSGIFGWGAGKLQTDWLDKWKEQIDSNFAMNIYKFAESRPDIALKMINETLALTDNSAFVDAVTNLGTPE